MLRKGLSLLFLVEIPQAESASGAWSCRKLVMHLVVTSPSKRRPCRSKALCCPPAAGLAPEEVFWGASSLTQKEEQDRADNSQPSWRKWQSTPRVWDTLSLVKASRSLDWRGQPSCNLGAENVVVSRRVLWTRIFSSWRLCPPDQMLMRSPSGNRVTARQEDGLIFAPTEDIYLQAIELCLCQDFFSGQLDTAGHITVSKRPGKTEDCGTVKVPLAETVGWGRSILHVWCKGKC